MPASTKTMDVLWVGEIKELNLPILILQLSLKTCLLICSHIHCRCDPACQTLGLQPCRSRCCYAQSEHSKISLKQPESENWKLPYNDKALNMPKQTKNKSLALCSFKVPLNKTCELNPLNLAWGKYRVCYFL